jgi:uncharacterized protein (DUF1697 family)
MLERAYDSGSRTEDEDASPVSAGIRRAAREGAGRGEASFRMTRYALLLRGVNIGAKNSLPMAELHAMLEKTGCTGVRTYVQSGNAVFRTALGEAALTGRIEAALARYMGRPIATTLRSLAQMNAIVAGNPFEDAVTNASLLCVTFLSRAPAKSQIAPLHAQDFGPELFRVSGREIYAWHPNGQGRSPLAAAIGKLPLRGAVTTRNWNTVSKLREMLGEV